MRNKKMDPGFRRDDGGRSRGLNKSRHCERSEAIQGTGGRTLDGFVDFGLSVLRLLARARVITLGICLLALLPLPALAAPPAPALAMHGTPRYGPDFTHFAYVNPDAPKGGTLRLGVVGTFDSLNPFIVRGTAPQGLGLGPFTLVYESLMLRSWDEPFTLYGLLAESVEVPDDRSAIIFTLRPEARWQDGEPVTADDVLFSYETLRAKGRPHHRTYYAKVAKAEKLGPRRVRFVFAPGPEGHTDREMPLIMGLMPVLPKHIWQGRDFNQTTLTPPVGSGPYRVENVEPGRSITYRRDPGYWGRDVSVQRGLYNFDVIRVDYYRDDSAALQALRAGQFDVRREPNPTKWTTAYESPALREGRLRLTPFVHHRPEAFSGFVLNTRRTLLQDPALREALALAFDSGWINRTLFQGLYRPTRSVFPNSELACDPDRPPTGRERTILERIHDSLAPRRGEGESRRTLPQECPRSSGLCRLLTSPLELASTDGTPASLRRNLLKATDLLKTTGYRVREDVLWTPANDERAPEPVRFEIMLTDRGDEKIALAWTRALERLGIQATTRLVDSAQAQARLNTFDFDVTPMRWFNSLSPGNEQRVFWGSAAADQPGSRNYAGVKDPAVDTLVRALTEARTREDLVATTHALDRILLAGHYVVPFFNLGTDPIAWWPERLAHPDVIPPYGPILEAWWSLHARP